MELDLSSSSFPRRCLEFGALSSFAVAALHVVCIFTGEATARFFGAPRMVLAMIQQGSLMIVPVVLVIVAVIGTFGLYAWSAAGRMRRLPLLRAGALAFGIIYLLRGLGIVFEIRLALLRPGLLGWQFFVFSAFSLLLGLAYLAGVIGRWRELGSPR